MDELTRVAEGISYIMPKIARKLLFGFFQSVDIPQTQLFTIICIAEKGSCRHMDLCQELCIAAPTVTGIIDRLEVAGYVRRTPDASDRRVVLVSLTSKGEKIATKFRSTVQERWVDILRSLSVQDRDHFFRIATKIERTL